MPTAAPRPAPTGGGNSPPQLAVVITGLQLFPTGGFITTSVGAINAYYDFSNFDGVDPTGQLRLVLTNLSLTLGDAVNISVPSVTITPSQSIMAVIPAATVSFPLFGGMGTATISNFQLLQTGFTLGSLTLSTPAGTPVNLGGVVSLGSARIVVSNFVFAYSGQNAGGTSVSGTITASGTSLALYPGLSFVSTTVGSFSISYQFATGTGEVLDINLNNLTLTIGGVFNLNVAQVNLTPGQPVVAFVSSLTATASMLGMQFTGKVTNLTLLKTGFELDNATLSFTPTGSIPGNLLTFTGGTISLAGSGTNTQFVVNDTLAHPVIGTLAATLTGLQLFPGSSLISLSGTATGSFDLSNAGSTGWVHNYDHEFLADAGRDS